MTPVEVVGAGLAGSEAAWQLVKRGIPVLLRDIKPDSYTPAHREPGFAELVCSNSLRAASVDNAVGLLKEEMRHLDSLVMRSADLFRIPAGGALAVDREGFSRYITETLKNHPLVTFSSGEVSSLPEGEAIIATGPLTTNALSDAISAQFGEEHLHFFDAAAPIVTFESIDMEQAFFQSRYGKGSDDYINCPMTKEEYLAFREALCHAEEAPLHGFEDGAVFEGCMPIEVMARRGEDTMRYGPLKPVGLKDPRTGEEPYAVVQLRQDDAAKTLYNLVGFQTHLKFPEQRRIFGMIPGLRQASYARYGVMHRNTYIASPLILTASYQCKERPNLFFAGQMTGVEGYVESAASGLAAGIHMARRQMGLEPVIFPAATAIGALGNYVSTANPAKFQPMNINFGIISPPDFTFKGKKNKNPLLAQRALELIDGIRGTL
jgi:methylenetetrahydrofolate--tRNA-(uracil-5-)-methyltransferase